jgi:hypothetical protein
MINKEEDIVAWVAWMDELCDARQHLDELVQKLIGNGHCDEPEFKVYLGHIYAHLNRAWHSRNQTSEITGEQWNAFSQFPKDLETVG